MIYIAKLNRFYILKQNICRCQTIKVTKIQNYFMDCKITELLCPSINQTYQHREIISSHFAFSQRKMMVTVSAYVTLVLARCGGLGAPRDAVRTCLLTDLKVGACLLTDLESSWPEQHSQALDQCPGLDQAPWPAALLPRPTYG